MSDILARRVEKLNHEIDRIKAIRQHGRTGNGYRYEDIQESQRLDKSHIAKLDRRLYEALSERNDLLQTMARQAEQEKRRADKKEWQADQQQKSQKVGRAYFPNNRD